ncbi:MAG: TonB family protein [Proteobacteria bacterium]|nr:TonB family protein [Pseudomonadota bacterium]
MIRQRQQHWMLAFLLAFATHFAVYLYSINLPGSPPVFRGGGSFDQSGKESPSAAGILVKLGKSGESSGEKPSKAALKEQAPAQRPQEALAQAFAPGEGKPGSDAKEAEPPETPEAASKRAPEPTVSPPAKDVGPAPEITKDAEKPETKITAAPIPKRKPKRPNLLPEMETLGRRLSVQGPAEATQSTAQAKPPLAAASPVDGRNDAGKPKGDEKTASEAKDDEKTPKQLSFINRGGGVGTASGNRTGEIRELNYEDRVMLWLKQHGAYPYEAAMYRLEDVVTLKFAINRQGKILYYELIKESKWHLLNQAVRRMMDRSSPVPPIPQEIVKDKITFTVPVHFGLHFKK